MKEYYRAQKGSKKHAISRWIIDKMFFGCRRHAKECQPNKILIICNGHIGDTIMSTGVFREIRKAYPKSEITVLTSNLAKPILTKNKNIDKILAMDFFWRSGQKNLKNIRNYRNVLKKIKAEKYDIAIALRSDLPNIFFFCYLTGIKNTAGYYNLDGGKPFLTKPLFYPEKEIHATKADLDLVNAAINLQSSDCFPEIPVDHEDIRMTNLFFDIHGINDYLCIVPGACAKLQTWEPANYKEIIEWMKEEYPNHKIILAGGKEDEQLIDVLSLGNNNCIKLINHNLRHLGLIFNHADCVLLQDGGPMHLAYTMMGEAANQKLIILWGPNPLEHVKPLRGKLIHHKLNCYPCMRREKDCKQPIGRRCMDLITLDEVKQTIKESI